MWWSFHFMWGFLVLVILSCGRHFLSPSSPVFLYLQSSMSFPLTFVEIKRVGCRRAFHRLHRSHISSTLLWNMCNRWSPTVGFLWDTGEGFSFEGEDCVCSFKGIVVRAFSGIFLVGGIDVYGCKAIVETLGFVQ